MHRHTRSWMKEQRSHGLMQRLKMRPRSVDFFHYLCFRRFPWFCAAVNFRSWAGCYLEFFSTTWISTLATAVIHALHKWKPAWSTLLLAKSRKEWLQLITEAGNDISSLTSSRCCCWPRDHILIHNGVESVKSAQDWERQDEINNQIPHEAQ